MVQFLGENFNIANSLKNCAEVLEIQHIHLSMDTLFEFVLTRWYENIFNTCKHVNVEYSH